MQFYMFNRRALRPLTFQVGWMTATDDFGARKAIFKNTDQGRGDEWKSSLSSPSVRPRGTKGGEEFERPQAFQRTTADDDEAETDLVKVMVAKGTSPDKDFEVYVSESRCLTHWRTRSFSSGCWASTMITSFEQ